ncbi:MAG: PSD1 domain-containing protein [Planctomycetaceae bacterium]|nr:PSD1 domain-containing protein [Planctomycetaceae bacterium]
MTHSQRQFLVPILLAGLVCSVVLAAFDAIAPAVVVASGSDEQPKITAAEELFVRRVFPIFQSRCLGCHGLQQGPPEGGLDLRSEIALKGGDSGHPLIVRGNPAQSPLLKAVSRGSADWSAMPPKEAERLTPTELEWISQWIQEGTPWPDQPRMAHVLKMKSHAWSDEDGVTIATSAGLNEAWNQRRYPKEALWAWQSLNVGHLSVTAPQTIDALIEQKVPEGLIVAPSAEAETLLRRASFDLLGLPPSVHDLQEFQRAFNADPESAVPQLIDRLLASPHYGERMAQHWLDVVRYADSAGFSNDYERGSAWRYRDYVVRSFNTDKPFDQFIVEQIAGDELSPDDPESQIATGFLRMGPWELTGMEVAQIARQRFLDDVTNSVGETFLAQPLQCARCHDHKFDPIPTRDYYALQSVFATTQLAERYVPFLREENQSGFEERRYLLRRQADYLASLETLDEALLKNADQWFRDQGRDAQQWNETIASVRKRLENSGKESNRNSKVRTARSDVFNQARQSLLKAGVPEDTFPPKLVGLTPEQLGLERIARKGLERLEWELDRYEPWAHAVYNGHTPDVRSINTPYRMPQNLLAGELEQTCILTGGDPFSRSVPIQPAALSVVKSVTAQIPSALSGRRLALAQWIADDRNPLTARVIANRIWMWHFGIPLAGNPNNFGSTGRRPTHSELLDVLAQSLIDNNWSIKALHRQIMLTRAYRRSGLHPDAKQVQQLDPELTSYAVFRSRRLSAEELRDSMLVATGELNTEIGGIPNRPEINIDVALQPRQVMGTFAAAWTPNPLPAQRHRRSIYALRLRGLADPAMEVFNQPSPDFSCERRDVSVVTPQVLSLFNSQDSYTRALVLADRVWKQANEDDEKAIQLCFQRTLGRNPTSDEKHACLKHWNESAGNSDAAVRFRRLPTKITREAIEENTGERFTFEEHLYSMEDFVPDIQPKDCDSRVHALADVCLVLLNSSEFSYVE